MQSPECRHIAGINAVHRYGIFRLAAMLPAPAWRNGLSLAFPASDIVALEDGAITPACIGLLGMAGALPYHYTEAMARTGSAAAHDFMDLLSAPAIDLFCTAWREARPELTPLPGIPAQRGPLRARALGEQFSQALSVPARIEQFAGCWDELPEVQRSALGIGDTRCGSGALLGARLWRLDGAVRIHIGPLGKQGAQAFLPGGHAARALGELWRAASGPDGASVQAEARIHLQPGACEGARLGAGQRLGYDMLLASGPTGERDDLRYRLC